MEKYYSINKNGYSVRCKLYCGKPADVKRVVVFVHGFAGHKDNKSAQKFADKLTKRFSDSALVIFDLPCHGDDARSRLTLPDCTAYIGLVAEDARTRFRTDELYACATSFGGYLALLYISENENLFRKIALRCPAVEMYGVLMGQLIAHNDLPMIEKGKPVMVGFDRKVRLHPSFMTELKETDILNRDYTAFADKLLIVQGTKDEIVRPDSVIGFAERNGISLKLVENADHRFTDPQKHDLAYETMIDFYGF